MAPVAELDEAKPIGLAEAKTSFSNIVQRVETGGETFLVMRYGKPVAQIAPLPKRQHSAGKARGILSAYADPTKRELEGQAFKLAMVSKHANSD